MTDYPRMRELGDMHGSCSLGTRAWAYDEILRLREKLQYSNQALTQADAKNIELRKQLDTQKLNLEWRRKREVLTDPRVYNGCAYSSEMQWTEWEVVEHDINPEKIEYKIDFWRGLNDIACERGEHERAYFRVRIA